MTIKTINFYKNTLSLLLLMALNFLNAQSLNGEKKSVDSLIKVANQYFMEIKTDDLLKISTVILQKSKEIHYDKGESYGYYYTAAFYSLAGNYKKSIQYLKKAKSYSQYLSKDLRQKFRIDC